MIVPVKRVIELLITVWLTGIVLSLWASINFVKYKLSIAVMFPSCFVPHNLCLLYDEVLRRHLTLRCKHKLDNKTCPQHNTLFFLPTLSLYCEFIFVYVSLISPCHFWSNRVEIILPGTRNYCIHVFISST